MEERRTDLSAAFLHIAVLAHNIHSILARYEFPNAVAGQYDELVPRRQHLSEDLWL